MPKQILLLPGDGIGPEVVTQARRVLELVAGESIAIDEAEFGGSAIEKHGEPLPATTLAQAQKADAVLLGAVGAPQYDCLPRAQKPETGLLNLRQGLKVFANLRPAQAQPALAASSPLREDIARELDVLIVRELIGGIYFGEPRGSKGEGDERYAYNTMVYSASEIRRIARVAFEAAGKRGAKLCSVDKANVLEVSVLWRQVINEVASEFNQVELSHMYVDNAAMQLAAKPQQFDVIVTSNLFGDILSDLASILAGSIGMLPSASLAEDGSGLYEPVHGSAPDIAGQDSANPCAAILSVAMMLQYSLGMLEQACAIRQAVERTLQAGLRTADICLKGQQAIGCTAMADAICENLGPS